jgi:hypothetical protein
MRIYSVWGVAVLLALCLCGVCGVENPAFPRRQSARQRLLRQKSVVTSPKSWQLPGAGALEGMKDHARSSHVGIKVESTPAEVHSSRVLAQPIAFLISRLILHTTGPTTPPASFTTIATANSIKDLALLLYTLADHVCKYKVCRKMMCMNLALFRAEWAFKRIR